MAADSKRKFRVIVEGFKPGVIAADKIEVQRDSRCLLIYRGDRLAGVLPLESLRYCVEEDDSAAPEREKGPGRQ
ncbi:MAG: hypothetical protein ACREUU_08265 [Gammaproteobacteria bacterium]